MMPPNGLPPAVSRPTPPLPPFSEQRGASTDELACRLERLASMVRGADPEDLLALGRGSRDPLELLVAWFALGYTDAPGRLG